MEEKKFLKISLSTFLLILALIVIVLMAYYIYETKSLHTKEMANLESHVTNMQNTIENLQTKLDSIPTENNSNNVVKNNTTSNATSKLSDSEIDKIALDLFKEGSQKIRETEYSDYSDYDNAEPSDEKTFNGFLYKKKNILYSDVEKEYSKIFTGEALNEVLNKRFLNIDDYLYVSLGGATGWDIANIKVSQTAKNNNEIEYLVTYNDLDINDELSNQSNCTMTIKLVNGEYRISAINYCNINQK